MHAQNVTSEAAAVGHRTGKFVSPSLLSIRFGRSCRLRLNFSTLTPTFICTTRRTTMIWITAGRSCDCKRSAADALTATSAACCSQRDCARHPPCPLAAFSLGAATCACALPSCDGDLRQPSPSLYRRHFLRHQLRRCPPSRHHHHFHRRLRRRRCRRRARTRHLLAQSLLNRLCQLRRMRSPSLRAHASSAGHTTT